MADTETLLKPVTSLEAPEASARFRSTLLLCDIRGFTQLLENTSPERAFRFIEKFLHTLTSAVVEEGGTINNLTGDGFLAQFGIGCLTNDHAARALNSAIEIRKRLALLNQERHSGRETVISVGIGIHTGPLAGGVVRLGDYEAFLLIGDTVNSVTRIESLTKEFSVDVLVSSETQHEVEGRFDLRPMPPREVKGKTEKVRTYWLTPKATKAADTT